MITRLIDPGEKGKSGGLIFQIGHEPFFWGHMIDRVKYRSVNYVLLSN